MSLASTSFSMTRSEEELLILPIAVPLSLKVRTPEFESRLMSLSASKVIVVSASILTEVLASNVIEPDPPVASMFIVPAKLVAVVSSVPVSPGTVIVPPA